MLRKIFLLFFICFSIGKIYAQEPQPEGENRDAYLAKQFFDNGAYEKAAEYYKVLIEQANGIDLYYDEYFQTLLALKDYITLKKIIKTAYKSSGKDVSYLIDLGHVSDLEGNRKDAEAQYSDVIKSLKPQKYEYQKVANKFIGLNELGFALKTYQTGAEKLGPNESFHYEIGYVYRLQNNKQGMMENYLDEVLLYPEKLTMIQNGLQAGLQTDEDFDMLEGALLKEVQKNKEQYIYQDLLVWLYMQRNDFDGALAQAKYLDMARNEGGNNVMRIAQTAVQQKDYDAAIKAYQYIIDKGPDNDWYVTATLEIINTKKDKLISSRNYTNADLLSIKDSYTKFLSEYYNDYTSSKAVIDLANLEAFYLHDLDNAIDELEKIIVKPQVNKDLVARAKLSLGDFYLLRGEPWESLLLYTQVEKDFKGNPTGEEAKFKNAKLSYYKGDFEWAQTQLKIIKGNTTELISNDAIDLSVFITDNMGYDSIEEPLKRYASADLLHYQNKDEEALKVLNDLLQDYPNHNLADDIYWLKSQIALSDKDFNTAIKYLENIVDEHGTDLWGDNSLFLWADIEQNNLNNPEKAKELYEKLILDYSGSTFLVETRKRYRILRGDDIKDQ